MDLITGDIVLGSPSNAEGFPSFTNSFIPLSSIDEADRIIFFALILPPLSVPSIMRAFRTIGNI
ncbi:hypothetical protein FRS11_05055 [Campylobacter jejuni]|nr:hypothetical protein [Campylobacter jejuni]PCH27903.1 hypothetical protein CPH95_08265 [Campylobacter sp. 1]EAC1919629.1 hypothetical protein [Campylobacter jejuni]EAC2050266.1 hypothetical protein [Campylobacter jejuni]EAH4633682.1 hypothetical protein [Campylobacter jejuni]